MMIQFEKIYLFLIFFCFMLSGKQAVGQVRLLSSNLSFAHAGWKLKNDSTSIKIMQAAIPISADIAIGRRISVSLNTSHVSTYVNREETEDYVMTGVTDIKLTGSFISNWRSPSDLLLTLGLNVPMPQQIDLKPEGLKIVNGLDADERFAQRWISRDFLDLPATFYWAGWEVNAGIYHALVTKQKFVWGCGFSYYYRGPFEYFRYRPEAILNLSDEITFTCGFDFDISHFLSHLDFYYTLRWSDKISGLSYFYPGRKMVIVYSGLFQRASRQLGIRTPALIVIEPRVLYRAVYGKNYEYSHPWIDNDALTIFNESGREQLTLFCKTRVWASNLVNFVVTTDYRVFKNEEPPLRTMWTLGAGLGLDGVKPNILKWIDFEFLYQYSFNGRQEFFGSVYDVSGSYLSATMKIWF